MLVSGLARKAPRLYVVLDNDQASANRHRRLSRCDARHDCDVNCEVNRAWQITQQYKLIIQYQISQVIKKILQEKVKREKIKSVPSVAFWIIRIRLEQKWYPIRLRIQKILQKSGSGTTLPRTSPPRNAFGCTKRMLSRPTFSLDRTHCTLCLQLELL